MGCAGDDPVFLCLNSTLLCVYSLYFPDISTVQLPLEMRDEAVGMSCQVWLLLRTPIAESLVQAECDAHYRGPLRFVQLRYIPDVVRKCQQRTDDSWPH